VENEEGCTKDLAENISGTVSFEHIYYYPELLLVDGVDGEEVEEDCIVLISPIVNGRILNICE